MIETLGLRNLTPEHHGGRARLTLPKRHIKVTKFVDYSPLETLGLAEPVTQLLHKIGLEGFVYKWAPTYQRFTLESFPSEKN